MPNISTLIEDIQKIAGKVPVEVKTRIEPHINKQKLRMSMLGPRCPKALWASMHCPEEEEKPQPSMFIKFNYGHLLEAMLIEYAKLAGHDVTGEQDAIVLDGVEGHRDCIIDGCIVDVKSSSSRGYPKFKNGTLAEDDPFGYLDQLDGYVVGSSSDPAVTVKDRGYFLAIDKQLGHICLYEHKVREQHIRERIQTYQEIVARKEPPQCRCGTVPDGKSGNVCLDVKASYSSYKYFCFPNLRTFLYSNGPRYLTRVERKPDVIEVDRYGKIVYS